MHVCVYACMLVCMYACVLYTDIFLQLVYYLFIYSSYVCIFYVFMNRAALDPELELSFLSKPMPEALNSKPRVQIPESFRG